MMAPTCTTASQHHKRAATAGMSLTHTPPESTEHTSELLLGMIVQEILNNNEVALYLIKQCHVTEIKMDALASLCFTESMCFVTGKEFCTCTISHDVQLQRPDSNEYVEISINLI